MFQPTYDRVTEIDTEIGRIQQAKRDAHARQELARREYYLEMSRYNQKQRTNPPSYDRVTGIDTEIGRLDQELRDAHTRQDMARQQYYLDLHHYQETNRNNPTPKQTWG